MMALLLSISFSDSTTGDAIGGGGARIVDKFKERKTFLVVEPKSKSKADTTILNSTDSCLD